MRNTARFFVVALAACAALLLSACGGKSIPAADTSDSLAVALRAGGLAVSGPTDNNPLDSRIFTVAGVYYTAGNEKVLAYEFDTASDAEEAAASISSDGFGVGSKYVGWGGDPHFYEHGRLVAVYVGNAGKLMHTLSAAMGEQVAGAS